MTDVLVIGAIGFGFAILLAFIGILTVTEVVLLQTQQKLQERKNRDKQDS